MKTAVIYQSQYGYTETYAKWLAEDLGADLLQARQVKPTDWQKYDTIVYGGGLYAGGVNGISLLLKNAAHIQGKALYLFTVGVSDMTNAENIKTIRGTLEKKLPPAIWKNTHLYHLRGGMSYSNMRFMHRMMMGMLLHMLRKKPEQTLRADEKAILNIVHQNLDFTDRATLAPLIADIQSGASVQ